MSGISEVLSAIESKCLWLKSDANELRFALARLPFRHDFETKAEAALDDAEQALIDTLNTVRTCRARYQAKPLERNHAA